MNKYMFLTAAIAVFAAPGIASGQSIANSSSNGGSEGSMTSSYSGANVQWQGAHQRRQEGGNGQQFQSHKAEILQRMSQRQSCVQAANDRHALKACMPRSSGQHGQQHMRRHGGNGAGGQDQ